MDGDSNLSSFIIYGLFPGKVQEHHGALLEDVRTNDITSKRPWYTMGTFTYPSRRTPPTPGLTVLRDLSQRQPQVFHWKTGLGRCHGAP